MGDICSAFLVLGFDGLFIDDGYETNTALLRYMTRLLEDEDKVLRVSFGDGLDLYPGGGMGVVHYFYISENYLIYAKNVGWDA